MFEPMEIEMPTAPGKPPHSILARASGISGAETKMANHPNRSRYTFHRQFAAHYAGRVITIPDQVAEDQRGYDSKSFPAIDAPSYPYNGRKIRVRLDGEAYGLHTGGSGDPICRAANSGENR